MLDAALVLLRLAQYAGAAILLGASLFLLYALPRDGALAAASLAWPRRLLLGGALLTLAGALLGLLVQTATMAGSLAEGLKPAALGFVASGTGIGRAALVRAAAATLSAAALLLLPAGLWLWRVVAVFGFAAAASWAWMGHGAATDGPGGSVHLAADLLHSLAAATWLGALPAFLILLWRPRTVEADASRFLHRALHGFAAIGSGAVATLLATGLVNSWFLVGLEKISALWTSDYGRLLSVKLLLFLLMLGLAGANRYQLTPRLAEALEAGAPAAQALTALRRSLMVETGAGVAILALVAWLGTLAPASAV